MTDSTLPNYAPSSRPSMASTRMAMARARLELPVLRRASGMFEGTHSSIFTGHGHDFEDLIEYNYGDDVTDIDWKSSARAGHPIIRRFERNSDVHTQLLIDTSVTMNAVTPSGEKKSELAIMAADLLGYMATSRGDRLGLVCGDSEGFKRYPARHGNQHLEFTLDTIDRHLRDTAGTTAVSAMLEHVLRLPQPRSLLLLITDEYWPGPSDEYSLRRIRTKHDVVVLQVADMPMTAENIARMKDAATGLVIPAFLRDDKQLREELVRERTLARERATGLLRATGVRHGRVESSDDVVPVLFNLLRRHGVDGQ